VAKNALFCDTSCALPINELPLPSRADDKCGAATDNHLAATGVARTDLTRQATALFRLSFLLNPTPHNEPPLDVARVVETTWIDRAHYLRDTGSTNDAALARVVPSPACESELFVTDHQSSGRGRGGNRWWSPPGALAFSVLTRELAISTDKLAQASLAVGVAISEALETFLFVDVRLKWPNDVYIDGRKVCGVLIETSAAAQKRLVIGVGVNVNNSVLEAPDELRDQAISMIDVVSRSPYEGDGRRRFDRTEVLAACVRMIGERLRMLEAGDPRLPELWRGRSLLTGRRVRIETPSREVIGDVESIGDDGALVVVTEHGIQRCYGGIVADF
jgi:BirA family biotin operon repressor/biotin-[acetyl-CoA-carboxylase] ligase